MADCCNILEEGVLQDCMQAAELLLRLIFVIESVRYR